MWNFSRVLRPTLGHRFVLLCHYDVATEIDAPASTAHANHQERSHGVRHILSRDGKLWNLKVWASGLVFLFGREGVLRGTLKPYRDFFREDFHPWQQDTQQLIKDWELHQLSN